MSSTLALITPVDSEGRPVDPGYGQGHPIHRPSNPIVLPPTPPGVNLPDNTLPGGGYPTYPVFIPDRPDNTLPTPPAPTPPGTIWPPLNPGDGVSGKCWLLVLVVGTEHSRYRWILVDADGKPPTVGGPKPPPIAQPK